MTDSDLDALVADMDILDLEPVVSTPVATSRGKFTSGGRGAKRASVTTLFHSASAFNISAQFATEGTSPPVCMGWIGSDGRRFCIIKGCTTKKHQSDKFEAATNHFYIKSSATQAFCAPIRSPLGKPLSL